MKAKYKRRLTSSPFISVDLIKTPLVKKFRTFKNIYPGHSKSPKPLMKVLLSANTDKKNLFMYNLFMYNFGKNLLNFVTF